MTSEGGHPSTPTNRGQASVPEARRRGRAPRNPPGAQETPWWLLVVFAVLGGLSPLQPPVDLVGFRVPPLDHPVLETR